MITSTASAALVGPDTGEGRYRSPLRIRKTTSTPSNGSSKASCRKRKSRGLRTNSSARHSVKVFPVVAVLVDGGDLAGPAEGGRRAANRRGGGGGGGGGVG